MRLQRLTSVIAVLAGSLFMCGCGGITTLAGLSVTITPAQATVAPGATLILMADSKGFNEGPPVFFWFMQGGPTSQSCAVMGSSRPSFADCPCGYIVYGSNHDNPNKATYYAPLTIPPGKCQVTFTATQISPYYNMIATAEITVAP